MSTTPSAHDLSIDIDESILEAALAAVESRTTTPPRATMPGDLGADVDIDLDASGLEAPAVAPAAPGAAPAIELARLRFRLDEAAHAHRKAEAELARLRSALAESESRTTDAREAARALTEDLERARARGKREAEEAQRRGEEGVLRVLLDVFDNVERARHHDDADPTALRRGITMTADQLRRQIERLGLERVVASPGAVFDPNVHEAMAHAARADLPEGTVAEELQAGFTYRGRLLRAARVTVVAALRGAT